MIDLEALQTAVQFNSSDGLHVTTEEMFLFREAADEIERLRASELALKREVLFQMRQRLILLTRLGTTASKIIEVESGIRQLEQEIQEPVS